MAKSNEFHPVEERAVLWVVRGLFVLVMVAGVALTSHIFASCNHEMSGQAHKVALNSAANWQRETGKEGTVSCDRIATQGGTIKCTLITPQKEVVPLECTVSMYMKADGQSCHLGQKAILDNH